MATAERSAWRRGKTCRAISCRQERPPNELQYVSPMNGSGYWRSLTELAVGRTKKEERSNECLPGAADWPNELSRRHFLRLTGASIALAGFTSCTKQAIEKIVPYVKQPEEVIPGRPLRFAT